MIDHTPATAGYRLRQIGHVASRLVRIAHAPRQADEGAPPARLVIDPRYRAGLDGIAIGDTLTVITWLHRAERDVVAAVPRDDATRDAVGVFATRAPRRPNPIGLHDVVVTRINPDGLTVAALEAVDGTPILDMKSQLGQPDDR